ncbi:Lrriq1 [Symbiodinium sp. KB8]|nr:Lrriq1 [Symbiodinium sp. KB8]
MCSQTHIGRLSCRSGAVSPSGRPKLQLKPRNPRLAAPGEDEVSQPSAVPVQRQPIQSQGPAPQAQPQMLPQPAPSGPALQPDPAGGRPRLVLKPRSEPPVPAPAGKAHEFPSACNAKSCAMEEPDKSDDPTQLILRRKGLRELQVLHFPHRALLRVVSLSHNALEELGPISLLQSLEELNVNHNRLSDLSPVASCSMLQVLLAANNRVCTVKGLEALPRLRRVSLYSNLLEDLDALIANFTAFSQLASLDLGGNPCFQDIAHKHGVVRALPGLKELDGDVLTNVDRQLAAEFFACAEEVGLERRPGSSFGLRPKTAPIEGRSQTETSPAPAPQNARTRSSSRRLRSARSRSSSRPRSGSPDVVEPVPAPTISDSPQEDLEKFQEYTKALQLRLQTTQVECENLQKQIHGLRQEAEEPILGTAALRDRLKELEKANQAMHDAAAKSRQMRTTLEALEAELLRRKQALGSGQERPGTGRTSARPGTAQAAVETVLVASQPVTLEGYKARCSALKREVEFERERTLQLRAKLCSQILGREISPPPSRGA